jgi:hypothetical protein
MSNRERFNREFQERAQRDAVAAANAILLGDLGIIDLTRSQLNLGVRYITSIIPSTVP